MNIVTCVEIVCGVIDRMKAFKTMELAMEYFNSIVPDDGVTTLHMPLTMKIVIMRFTWKSWEWRFDL